MAFDTNFVQKTNPKETPPEKKQAKKGVRALFRRKELGVNLISPQIVKEVSRQIERKNLIQISVSLAIAAGLVALAYLGIFIYDYVNNKNLNPVRDRLTRVNQEIASLEQNTQALSAFQNTLGSLRTLLNDHIYWTRFLQKLEEVTLKSVKYESLTVSSTGNTFVLSARGDTYSDVGKQLRAFQDAKEIFPAVSIAGANALIDQGGQIVGVNFTLSLTFNLDSIKGFEHATSTSQ